MEGCKDKVRKCFTGPEYQGSGVENAMCLGVFLDGWWWTGLVEARICAVSPGP